MIKKTNILTQEQKDELCRLHWSEGTLWEDEYYQVLCQENEELGNIYEKCFQEVLEEFDLTYEQYLEDIMDFSTEYPDEMLLLLMQKLDDELQVGLYED